jgi:hypothetical protein
MKSTLPTKIVRARQALMCLAGACLLGSSLSAAAFDSRGARSCGDWTQHRLDAVGGHKLNSDISQTWLVGYLSGMVAGSGMDFLTGTKNPVLFGMADDLCRKYPQADLAFIGTAIARELMQEKDIVNLPTLP